VFPCPYTSAEALGSATLSHVAVGLHFLRVDGDLDPVGRQKVVARLDRRGCEQCAYLSDWYQDGTVWLRSSESLLHRALLIQSPGMEKVEQIIR
jgi:hypothetical protein